MERQRLYSYLRQAIDKYNMIEEGDRIAIGLSGGKDSMTLLHGMAGLHKFYPEKFDLVAVTVDLGYDGFDTSYMSELCKQYNVEYHVVKTNINEMLGSGECSLCARLRKGAFNNKIIELGCNKFAYAHNMDDVIETMMLSLIYEGRFSTFWPVTPYEDTGITLIRPMIMVSKAEVSGFCNKEKVQIVKNPCPYSRVTEREYVRTLIKEIEKHAPGTKKRMMTAIQNGQLDGWDK